VPPEAVAAPEPAAPSPEVEQNVNELEVSELNASLLAEPKPKDDAARLASRLAAEADTLQRSGELGEAKPRFLEALRASPTCAPALVGLALVELVQGNGKEALDYAIRLRQLRPGQPGYLLVLATVYAHSGQPNEARMVWEAAAKQGSLAARARLEAAP
jgi:tetratricopeptide (TPR) repeat protein